MSYERWRAAFGAAAAADPRLRARLWNLEHESRVPKQLAAFKERLAQHHKKRLSEGASESEAAPAALEDARNELRGDLKDPLLGALPVSAPGAVPDGLVTHMPRRDLVKYYGLEAGQQPSRAPITLPRPLKTGLLGQPVTRFIWMTFPAGPTPLGNDPDGLVHELGLAHFSEGDFVYCLPYALANKPTFVPSCLDADLYEAWAPPPLHHEEPWGLTRHLTTGQPSRPELLTNVADYLDYRPTATLVSPPGPPKPIGTPKFDPLANRE